MVLTSGSLSPIIQRLAVRLGTDGHVATPVAAATNGCFSGATDGPMLFGEEKLRRLSHFADIAYGRWELFAAYGDHESDGALLEAARHPVAVSPTRLLLAAARAKGWTIRYW